MSLPVKRILQEGLSLPPQERRRVAETLLDSIPHESVSEIEEAWNQEAVRRAERVERGEVEGAAGEEALRELEAELASLHRR